jgi:hypothetical protein
LGGVSGDTVHRLLELAVSESTSNPTRKTGVDQPIQLRGRRPPSPTRSPAVVSSLLLFGTRQWGVRTPVAEFIIAVFCLPLRVSLVSLFVLLYAINRYNLNA